MRLLIQRVTRAQITAKGNAHLPLAAIDKGFVVLAGFEADDTPLIIEQMVQKMKSLRVFSDSAGKMNFASSEVNANWLLVSQFTLYAECKYGNRPSFDTAAPKLRAKEYYQHFISAAQRLYDSAKVKHGEFGSDLEIELVNDGPVTLFLDSKHVL